ncbi:hypothetical protein D3C87_1303640 [compost metagenome]
MLTNKACSTYHNDTLFNGSVNFAFSITCLKIQDDSLLKCTHNSSPSIRTNAIKNIKQLKKYNTSIQYAYSARHESRLFFS